MASLLYSEVIELCPENALYLSMRSDCHFATQNYKESLKDGEKSVALDSTFTYGYECIIKNCLIFGEIVDAENAIKKLTDIGSNATVTNEYEKQLNALKFSIKTATKFYGKKQFEQTRMN